MRPAAFPAGVFQAALAPVLLLAWTAAGAADEDYVAISPSQIRAGEFRPGEKRSVTGKYQELINRELKLYDLNVRFLLNQQQLGRQIFELKAEKDNLTLLGFFREPAREGSGGDPSVPPVFEVERIKAAPSDAELFETRLAGVLAEPGRGPEKLRQLALEVASVLKRFPDPTLAPVARKVFAEAFKAAEATLPAQDVEGRLGLIRTFHASLGDVELTVAFLKVLAKKHPDHAGTRAFLRDLHCVQIQGDWLTYSQFKRTLGFVLRGDQWVKPTRKEFLDLIDQLRREKETQATLILRSRTDREYRLLAQSGKLEKGMTREEVAEALGLSDRVERRVEGGNEIDQWNYGERRVYLFNGQVVGWAP